MEGYTWVIDLVFNKAFWKKKKESKFHHVVSQGSSAELLYRSTAQSFATCANEVFDNSSRLSAFTVTDPTEEAG